MLRAQMVHGTSDQLLAGSGFARDKHGAPGPGNQLDAQDDVCDRLAVAHNAVPAAIIEGFNHRSTSASHNFHAHPPEVTVASTIARRHQARVVLPVTIAVEFL